MIKNKIINIIIIIKLEKIIDKLFFIEFKLLIIITDTIKLLITDTIKYN